MKKHIEEIDWQRLDKEESYKLSMAEFKGATIQALKDIKKDVGVNRDDIQSIQNQLNNMKLMSSTFGVVGGLVSGFLTALGLKR